MRRLQLLMLYMATASMPLSHAVFAQGTAGAYPSKPVAVIIPFAPGGAADLETRRYMPKMTELLGQQFIIDYKAGVGSSVGTGYVAKSAPDGHTLLVATGSFVSFPPLYPDLNFDIVKDFAPVSLMSLQIFVMVASPSFTPKNAAEYIAYAKANPGKINFGTSGAGSGGHLAGAWLHSITNTKPTFVHYKGTGPLMLDLVAGRLDVTPTPIPVSLQLIKTGKLRALAVMGDKRSNLLPGISTIAEQGAPGYSYSGWLGFVAPATTPEAIINKLSDAFAKVSKMPDVAGPLEAEGEVMVGSTPAQLRQVIVTEAANWRKVISEAGIKLEQ